MGFLTDHQQFVIEAAAEEDLPAIKAVTDAAFSKYIERLGKLPEPMTADYSKVIKTEDIYVLRADGRIYGSICISARADFLNVSRVAVDIASQGRSYGHMLMEFAEQQANAQDLVAITLFTNAKMYENLEMYQNLGYKEVERRTEAGYDRVYFRKELKSKRM